ncbi:PREDICTED: cytochrome P450 72A13-like [Brassica oleracea var. oleracea]|nr:PREDICTED: cytochrome P450 72A13-like [Brassica oleracea var. oleracea]XP_013610333.1 PREDICTED: cytochrome P450 72A13-like [Brassica oleracea var. oleracea]
MSLPVVAVALMVVLAAVLIRVVNWVWITPKKLERYLRRQGLHGTPYTPLVGDIKRNVKMLMEARSEPITPTDDIIPYLLPLALKMFNSHGRTFFMWTGPIPTIMITNPEHIKEVFSKTYDFEATVSSPLVKLLVGGLASYKGDKWARHRRIINPAFNLEKIKNMVPAFYHCSSEVVSQWERQESSCEVDVWPWLVNLTADVISHAAFGSSYREGQRIFELQGELSGIISQEHKKPYIPGMRFYPTKNNKRMKAIDKEIDTILRGMVSKREDGEAEHNDLLGILLESSSEESGGNGLSVEEVLRECKLCYFAGQETTSVLLVWTMVLLSHHQDWQERAREEVRLILDDKNNKPDIESLSHLKVMSMIFYEVLRLNPPVSQLRREVNKEVKLGNVTLPAGVKVYIPTALIHRDPELWGEDAREFKPERFREGISKATKNQVCYSPFGWGLRICIGQNFSLLEAKMAMSLILLKFSFELSASYVHSPQIVMTTRPQFGAHLILHKL